jgi:hypothetical protein
MTQTLTVPKLVMQVSDTLRAARNQPNDPAGATATPTVERLPIPANDVPTAGGCTPSLTLS